MNANVMKRPYSSRLALAILAGLFTFGSGIAVAQRGDSDAVNLQAQMRGEYYAMGDANYYMKEAKSGVSEIFNAEVRVDLPNDLLPLGTEPLTGDNAEDAEVLVDLVEQEGATPYATCILAFTGLTVEEDVAVRAHYAVKLRRQGERVMPDTGICVGYVDQSADEGDASEDDNPGKDDNDGIRPVMPEVEEGDLAIGVVNGVEALAGAFE